MNLQYYICESCGHKAVFLATYKLAEGDNCGKCGGEWLYACADSKAGVKL